MRTVTFSDADVASFVNGKFVCAWENRRPGFSNGELDTERWISIKQGEIFATRNIFSFVLDSDRRVLHYFSGYYKPALYKEEMRFAHDLWEALVDDEGRAKKDGTVRFLQLHDERMKFHREEVKNLQKMKRAQEVPEEFAQEVERLAALFPEKPEPPKDEKRGWDGGSKGRPEYTEDVTSKSYLLEAEASRRQYLIEGLQALARVHKDLTGKVRASGRLFPLKKGGYKYGNEFAEE